MCLTHDLWVDLSDQIDTFLQSITLASLVQRQNGLSKKDASSTRISATLLN